MDITTDDYDTALETVVAAETDGDRWVSFALDRLTRKSLKACVDCRKKGAACVLAPIGIGCQGCLKGGTLCSHHGAFLEEEVQRVVKCGRTQASLFVIDYYKYREVLLEKAKLRQFEGLCKGGFALTIMVAVTMSFRVDMEEFVNVGRYTRKLANDLERELSNASTTLHPARMRLLATKRDGLTHAPPAEGEPATPVWEGRSSTWRLKA